MKLLNMLLGYQSIDELITWLDQYMMAHASSFTHASYKLNRDNSGWWIVFTVNNMTYKTEDINLRTAILNMKRILPPPKTV